MERYSCPDCGWLMTHTALLTDPPVYEARCNECGVLYRRRSARTYLKPLPRDYDRIGIPSTPPRDGVD